MNNILNPIMSQYDKKFEVCYLLPYAYIQMILPNAGMTPTEFLFHYISKARCCPATALIISLFGII